MKSGQNLRANLFLFLLLGGVGIGLISGFVFNWIGSSYAETGGLRLDVLLMGLVIGLCVAVYSFFMSRWSIIHYLGNLYEEFKPHSDDPDANREEYEPEFTIKSHAAALFDLLNGADSEAKRLRDRLGILKSEADERLASHPGGNMDDLKQHLENLRAIQEQISAATEKLQQDQKDLIEQLRAIGDRSRSPSSVEEGLDLDPLVNLGRILRDRFDTISESVEGIAEATRPLGDMPEELRLQIEKSNELLVDMAGLFREFPHEDLPRLAEALRRETREWDALARDLENVRKELGTCQEELETAVEQTIRQTRRSVQPDFIRNQVKAELDEVDNVLEQIQRLTDADPGETLRQDIDEIQSRMESMSELNRTLQDELENELDRVQSLDALARKVTQVKDL